MSSSSNVVKDSNNFPNLNNNRNFHSNQESFFLNPDKEKVKGTYFVVRPKDNNQEFLNLNPFWIQKGFDGITTDIERISKQKDGSLLVLSKSERGSTVLKKAVRFADKYDISVEEHPSFNNTQGLIYCYELKQMSQNDILEELQNQGVINVHAMTKLINGVRSSIGLYVITFKAHALPKYIKVGYLTIKVKTYIPNPMRCILCQKFGHTQKYCTDTKICKDCSEPLPHENCGPVKCHNCNENHTSNSKTCSVYIKESKIIEIKTLENVSIAEARRRYNSKINSQQSSFVEVTSNNNLIMKEIESLRNELEIFKKKDAEYKENLEKELIKNQNLVEQNRTLAEKVKKFEDINKNLTKENKELSRRINSSTITKQLTTALKEVSIKKRGRPSTRKSSASKPNLGLESEESDDVEQVNLTQPGTSKKFIAEKTESMDTADGSSSQNIN